MAKDFMAQMLDELMGRNRNAAPNERKELRWDDPTVCKHFLAYYCPNELFTNTKADLGICRDIHDEELKKQYQADPRRGNLGYEDDFLRFLKTMVQDVDRRIERGKGRLESTRQQGALNSGTGYYDNKIKELSQKIEECVQEAEKLGSIGKVEEAQSKLRQSDQLRKERDTLKTTIELAVQQEKQLEVCEVCGAFLIVGDAQQRIDDHLAGKQHVGYARIRDTLKEEEDKLNKQYEDRRRDRSIRSSDRSSRGRDSERDRNGRTRSRSRDRSRRSDSRDRYRRRHSRSRSGDRSKRRDRSRSGSRRKDRDRRSSKRSRSRSKDRKDRRRSRSRGDRRRRSRDKDEKRRDRSRSRDRKKRTRSSSRDKNRTDTVSPASGKSFRNGEQIFDMQNRPMETTVGESQQEQVPTLETVDLPKNIPHPDSVVGENMQDE